MAAKPHHSIGEVLSLLHAEFEDVTISKIRFLESQGLIALDRTPTGYRKFYPKDVARLRWILTQQRDHFLPIKEIRKQVKAPDFELEVQSFMEDSMPKKPSLFKKKSEVGGARPKSSSATAAPRGGDANAASKSAAKAKSAKPKAARKSTSTEVASAAAAPTSSPTSAAALAEKAGVDSSVVRELERLGLLESTVGQQSLEYGPEALEIAKMASVFGEYGMHPRHLRMYKVAAERLAGVLQQIFAARIAREGEDSVAASRELNRLVSLGESLQRIVLARTFGDAVMQGEVERAEQK